MTKSKEMTEEYDNDNDNDSDNDNDNDNDNNNNNYNNASKQFQGTLISRNY